MRYAVESSAPAMPGDLGKMEVYSAQHNAESQAHLRNSQLVLSNVPSSVSTALSEFFPTGPFRHEDTLQMFHNVTSHQIRSKAPNPAVFEAQDESRSESIPSFTARS